MRLSPEDAWRLFGFTSMPRTAVEVKQAFSREVMLAHPDTGISDPTRTMDQLKLARDLLLEILKGDGVSCPSCKGKGCIPARLGVITCSRCNGEGRI